MEKVQQKEICCDNGNNEFAFMHRTRELLKQYRKLINDKRKGGDSIVSYSRTLLLNCCVGLLFIPREKLYQDERLKVSLDEWRLDKSTFQDLINPGKEIMVQDVVSHLRNALAHFHIECLYDENNDLSEILFKDIDPNKTRKRGEEVITFIGKMPYIEFESFVLRLSGMIE